MDVGFGGMRIILLQRNGGIVGVGVNDKAIQEWLAMFMCTRCNKKIYYPPISTASLLACPHCGAIDTLKPNGLND